MCPPKLVPRESPQKAASLIWEESGMQQPHKVFYKLSWNGIYKYYALHLIAPKCCTLGCPTLLYQQSTLHSNFPNIMHVATKLHVM